MTKSRKIKLLTIENKRLIDENKMLHAINNEEINKKMLALMGQYSDIIEKLHEKYQELNKLKFIGIQSHLKYRLMLWKLKVKELLMH
ncbi:hypothetical protein D7V86_03370 [bacterium D16-51]|nr:hypothetical protein D7V96_00550 [bacterium D16-59]RKI61848.1 hypothetical protein D7V86_03370 [bacterium D16-51]